jgi:hypothetical protein
MTCARSVTQGVVARGRPLFRAGVPIGSVTSGRTFPFGATRSHAHERDVDIIRGLRGGYSTEEQMAANKSVSVGSRLRASW